MNSSIIQAFNNGIARIVDTLYNEVPASMETIKLMFTVSYDKTSKQYVELFLDQGLHLCQSLLQLQKMMSAQLRAYAGVFASELNAVFTYFVNADKQLREQLWNIFKLLQKLAHRYAQWNSQ